MARADGGEDLHWYLVKQNWDRIVRALETSFPRSVVQYVGLGGDVWPLDQSRDPDAVQVHSRLMNSRQHIAVDDNHEEYLCVDRNLAMKYYSLCAAGTGDSALIEVWCLDEGVGKADGIDFGAASGGYSVIETEIILKGNVAAGRWLNEKGVFVDQDAMNAFLQEVEEAEAAGECEALSAYSPFCVRRIA